MKPSHTRRFFALLALALLLITARAEAQFTTNLFGVLLDHPTNSVSVGSPFTYSVLITNRDFNDIRAFVTNTFSGPVRIDSATNTINGLPVASPTIAGKRVVFDVVVPAISAVTVVSVTATATNAGIITNRIDLFETDLGTSGALAGFAVITHSATNILVAADLAVRLFGPATAVYSNDWTSYRVVVTNSGSAVTNVMLTNTFPATVGLIKTSPTNSSASSGRVIFSLGNLTNHASRSFTVQVQPTNSGTVDLSAFVGAANLSEASTSNNVATTNFQVLDFVTASLTASNVTGLTNNMLTGLFNQTVRLSNTGTGAVQSARLIVAGVPELAIGKSNRLYNASGTNNGNPFVVYGGALGAGQSVDLVLEYYSALSHKPFFMVANSNYQAVAINAVDFTSSGGTNGSFLITNISVLSGGRVLIGFRAAQGKNYTVLYGDSPSTATNPAQPTFPAPANVVGWIDEGPPKTLSSPGTNQSRYYRVRQEP